MIGASVGLWVPRRGGVAISYPNLARQFTTANAEYFTCPDQAALSFGAGVGATLGAWVYLDSKANIRPILTKWAFPNEEYWFGYDNGYDRFKFSVSGTDGSFKEAIANTLGSPSLSTWYFVVGRMNVGTSVQISVNAGAWDTTAHTMNIRDQAAPFRIGAAEPAPAAGQTFAGRLDEPFVFKRALSDAEVAALYNGGTGFTYPDLAVGGFDTTGLADWWRFNETSGDETGAHAGIVLTDTNTVTSAAGKR